MGKRPKPERAPNGHFLPGNSEAIECGAATRWQPGKSPNPGGKSHLGECAGMSRGQPESPTPWHQAGCAWPATAAGSPTPCYPYHR
jgi:hypothetical protein